jgi:hypothetical protein
MDGLFELYEDLTYLRSKQALETPEWNTSLEMLERWITTVKNEYTRRNLRDRFIKLLYNAKRIPIDRALSFNVIKAQTCMLTESLVEHCEKTRTALDLQPSETPWAPIDEEWTDE